ISPAVSPAISSGRCRHLASVFWSLRASGRTGAGTEANLNFFRNCHFLRNDVSNHFTYIFSLVLCPVPCLHFDCSFCLETEKSPWCPKSVPFGQNRF
ncbi:unnamed protein product, partial [Staurois parvus]